MSSERAGVVAVVPVKGLARAKSRLDLASGPRTELARAFALDTVTALAGARTVSDIVVVTDEPEVASALAPLGAHVIPDGTSSLNAAIRRGAQAAQGLAARAVLIVPADLPCLRPEDVDAVVSASTSDGGFVADRAGTGTTLVLAPAHPLPTTAYGADSAARHTALGFSRVEDPPVRACQDVDTGEDLRVAVRLGVGRHTAAVLAGTSLTGAQT